jgi:hypothetical protein
LRLSPLGTSATIWLIVSVLRVWSSWWCVGQEKPKYSGISSPSAVLSCTNPTWPDLGSNPSRSSGKPAIKRLSYGTASSVITFVVGSLISCLAAFVCGIVIRTAFQMWAFSSFVFWVSCQCYLLHNTQEMEVTVYGPTILQLTYGHNNHQIQRFRTPQQSDSETETGHTHSVLSADFDSGGNGQNHWVYGLCPSSEITRKHNVSGTISSGS